MTRRPHSTVAHARLVGVVVAVASLCVACGDSAVESPSGVVHFDNHSSATSPRTVRVGLIEWTITKSRTSVPPGRVQLDVTNAGATVHDLAVQGQLGHWQTPDLSPGQHAVLTIRGHAGETLRMWCTEPGHAADGMRTTLAVR